MAKNKNSKNNTTSNKEEKLEVLKGMKYVVELKNGYTVEAYVSGKMRVNTIRILPGDTVIVELSPYDLTRGRIIWNKR